MGKNINYRLRRKVKSTAKLCSRILIVCFIMLLSLGAVLPATALADETPVTFPDAGLEAAIRDAIAKPSGDIYQSDLEALISLKAESANISDIHGIEYCTNLEQLYLDMNQITDISPLTALTKLQGLWIYMNQISDISSLAGLSSLTGVYLCYNQISDISALAGLTGLQVLYCSNNQLSDISSISSLANVNMLNLSGNNIVSITPLSGLNNLNTVNIGTNKIDSITPLVSNTGIGTGDAIDLTHNYLDISPGSSDLADIQTLTDRAAAITYEPQNAPPAEQFTLTTQVNGNGTITRSPEQSTYDSGSFVQLTANPASGWEFTGWTGDIESNTNPVSLTMDNNKTVTANFIESPAVTYTLSMTIIGNGTVTKSPDELSYETGTSVNLTAVPETGWYFYGWNGGLYGSANTSTITINANTTVWATFVEESSGPYTIVVDHVGNGSVIVSPDQPVYETGATVNLTAVSDTGWTFAGWGGDLSGTDNPTSLTMDDNKMVSATFVSPSGSGTTRWWNNAWSRRMEVTVTENSGVNLTDYQVKFPVIYDADMQEDFSDIRFINAGDSAELSYWMDNVIPATSADFWVKVPYIPASGTATLFMYYGNSACTTTSNIHDTFIWGDDFEDLEWTNTNINQINYDSPSTGEPSDQYNTEDGLYIQKGAAASEPIAELFSDGSMKVLPLNYIAEIEVNPVIKFGSTIICPRYQAVDDKYETLININFNSTALNKVVNDNWTYIAGAPLAPKEINPGTWYALSTIVTREGSTNRFRVLVDDIQYIDATDSSLAYTGLALITYDLEDSFQVSYDDFRLRQFATAEPMLATGEEQAYSDFLSVLTVNIVGQGDVSKSLDLPFYEVGTTINLTAIPVPGWYFTGWNGDIESNANRVSLTIDADKVITAVFSVSDSPAPSSSGGGGGGGGGSPMLTLNPLVFKSSDGKVVINIPAGTMFLNGSGYSANHVWFQKVSDEKWPPLPAGMTIMSAVYNLTPDKTTFEPAAQITFYYDKALVPDGLNSETILIAYWDDEAKKWVSIEGCICDPSNGTITVGVTHLTVFAVMAPTRSASFALANLEISPDAVQTGEPTIIAVQISNNGDLKSSYEVVLKIDGFQTQQKNLTIAGGDIESVSFEISITEPGSHTIEINGLRKTITVIEPATPEPEEPATPVAAINEVPSSSTETHSSSMTPWPWLIAIISGVLILGTAVGIRASQHRTSSRK